MDSDLFEKESKKFFENISLETKSETLILLKGHLLLEDLMREYCASKVIKDKYLMEARLGFMHVLGLTRAFVESGENQWIWSGLEQVNSMRNKLAHNLNPQQIEIKKDKFIQYVNTASKVKFLTDENTPKFANLTYAIYVLFSELSSTLKFKPRNQLFAKALLNYNQNINDR